MRKRSSVRRQRTLAGVVLVGALTLTVPAAAIALGSVARSLPVAAPVCPSVLPGTVRCTSVLLTDQSTWSAALPPMPDLGGVLGLLTTTTTRPRPTTTTSPTSTTSTTRPTTTTSTTRPTTTTSTTQATSTTTTTIVPPPHAGYGPADLQSAYGLTSAAATGGQGQTIAIVDPYDHPNAEADLGVYRSQYGLPACTTDNGCFRKVDQRGGATYPAVNGAWAQETSLDIDMVSAACPNCNILLVEADSVSDSDINAAENRAASMGANAISNSFTGPDTADDSAFRHPGIAITAASGDFGYEANFPASSNAVTAVGGTTLTRSANTRGWSETAFSRSGSGCAV